MTIHILQLPARLEALHAEGDERPRFRAVFATLDEDNLAASLSQCYGCYEKGILYPSAFSSGAAAPLQVGHWSNFDTVPFGAGYIEVATGEAALLASPAPTAGAQEDAARVAHLIEHGLGECSASIIYDEVRRENALSDAERAAGADFALVRGTVLHVAVVQSGAVPNNTIDLYSAFGGDCRKQADNRVLTGAGVVAEGAADACSLAEAQAEALLIRGEFARRRATRSRV